MNQEEREAFTQQTTQRMVAYLQQTTNAASEAANAEKTIRSMLNRYVSGRHGTILSPCQTRDRFTRGGKEEIKRRRQ
jgi:hypothetical protein